MNYSELVQNVIDGVESPIKAYAVLKTQKEHIEKCLEEIGEEVNHATENYEKHFTEHGFKFEKRSGGKYYDFSDIREWKNKKDELVKMESNYKAAYSNYEKGQQSVTEDGELVPLPVVKFKKDSLIVKKIDNPNS